MHPRGKPEPAVYDLIGVLYAHIQEAESWTDGAKSVSEIAVLQPALTFYRGDRDHVDMARLNGATRMLMELTYQFDVCDGEGDLSGYRVIVLPDHVELDEPLQRKLSELLTQGVYVISAGFGGLDSDGAHFALPQAGALSEGLEPPVPSFFRAHGEAGRRIPDMLMTIYDQGIVMRRPEGSEALADLHWPNLNQISSDWQHENVCAA